MILRPLLSIQRPTLYAMKTQVRSVRPTIRINKHKFQIVIDMHQFKKEEIVVKARQEFVIIQGKHERQIPGGYIVRKFKKKIRLPKGCDPENMISKLSDEGILTITAEREFCETHLPCEAIIRTKYGGPAPSDDPAYESFMKLEAFDNIPCERPPRDEPPPELPGEGDPPPSEKPPSPSDKPPTASNKPTPHKPTTPAQKPVTPPAGSKK